MLRAIELENFKALGKSTRIELAPITLIYGENSAGKSTILQALSLLKQTLESRERARDTALLPKVEGGLVDLGSFRELLFDHDLSKSARIGIAVEPSADPREDDLYFRGRSALRFEPFQMDFTFGQSRATADVRLMGLGLAFEDNQFPSTEYKTRRLKSSELREFGRFFFRPGVSSRAQGRLGYAAECTEISSHEDHWHAIFKPWHSSRLEVVEMLRRDRRFIPTAEMRRQSQRTKPSPKDYDFPPQVDRALKFYSSEFTIQQFIERIRNPALKQLSLIDGFIPRIAATEIADLPELTLSSRFRPGSKLKQHLPVLDFAEKLARAGALVEKTLNAVFPLGPFRRPPERWYMFPGTSPIDVGYQGDHLPDLLLQSRVTKRANEWLEKLEIGYQLKPKRIGGAGSDLFAVRLEDTRRAKRVEVALSDVGFGISQILPFIVQCLASKQRIISIEQPEVHIHPRLQADLGNLIAETIKEEYGHQFLIETHSEHLVLRLQRLVREGKLRPIDLSIIFVSRGQDGSTVRRLHLDDSGDFLDEWPGGFFPERLNELR